MMMMFVFPVWKNAIEGDNHSTSVFNLFISLSHCTLEPVWLKCHEFHTFIPICLNRSFFFFLLNHLTWCSLIEWIQKAETSFETMYINTAFQNQLNSSCSVWKLMYVCSALWVHRHTLGSKRYTLHLRMIWSWWCHGKSPTPHRYLTQICFKGFSGLN